MKHFYLTLLVLVGCALNLSARKVSIHEATAIAEQQMNQQVYIPTDLSRSEAPSPNYRIFIGENGKGFVIVATDTRLPMILGYSHTGVHDVTNLPPQLRGMLSGIDSQLASMSESAPDDPTWTAAIAPLAEDGAKVLPTAEWAQDAPFNQYAPVIDGVKAPAGCTAVALATVMRYHKYPECGNTNIKHFVNIDVEEFDLRAHKFKWDKMPLTVDETTTQEEKDAIAELIYTVGKAANTQYSPTLSSTISGEEGLPLTMFFDYSPECQFIYKEDLTDERFMEITLSQIDAGLPVLYCGAPLDIPMGHVWVVDGYSADRTQLRCNFGWGGNFNGFYPLNSLMGRYYCDGILFDIKPGNDTEYTSFAKAYDNHYREKKAIEVSKSAIRPGEPFYFCIRCVAVNSSYFEDPVDRPVIALAIMDENDNILEIAGEEIISTYPGADPLLPVVFQDIFTSQLKEIKDSYKLQLLFSPKSSTKEWKKIIGTDVIATSLPATDMDPIDVKQIRFDVTDDVVVKMRPIGPDTSADLEEVPHDYVAEHYNVFSRTIRLNPKEEKPNHVLLQEVNGRTRGSYLGWLNVDAEISDYQPTEIDIKIYRIDTTEVVVKASYAERAAPMSIVMDEAGTLSSIVDPEKARTTPSLTVSGPINAYDIWFIGRAFQTVHSLDLTNAQIMEVRADSLPSYEQVASYNIDSVQVADKLPDLGLTEMYCLSDIKLPKGLKKLGRHSLARLLISRYSGDTYVPGVITLPATLESIDHHSLNCYVDTVKLLATTPPEIDEDAIYYKSLRMTLCVPPQSLDLYRKTPIWNRFTYIIPLPESASVEENIISPAEDPDPDVMVYDLKGSLITAGKRSAVRAHLPGGIYLERINKTNVASKITIKE